MKTRTRTGVVALATALTGFVVLAPATTASASSSPVRVVTSGLNGPFGLQAVGRHSFVVAEGGAGQVTYVGRHGQQHVVFGGAPGVSGVAASRHHVFGLTGGGDETGPAPTGGLPASSVLRSTRRGHHVRVIADLAAYELRYNPDGQRQFDDAGVPYDALSNPFSMNLSRYGLLVADGGANDVLRVNPRTGHVSTFFVPHTVTDVPACLAEGAQANPGTVGCDPVPTGVAVARHSVYVSTLGAEVPGAGRVYRLNPRTGRVLHVWKGLTAPTGVAVSPHGDIYVSEVLYGAPEGPPSPGFDPSSIGRITKISRHGRVTHTHVTTPTGLDFAHGHLYATSGSLGAPGTGTIVKVGRHAFR